MAVTSAANWILRSLMTCILSGAGFVFITLVLQYAKRYSRSRQEKEKARVIAEQFLKDALLQECYGSRGVIIPKVPDIGCGSTSCLAQLRCSLFQMYKRSGCFLGFGRRRQEENSTANHLDSSLSDEQVDRILQLVRFDRYGSESKLREECGGFDTPSKELVLRSSFVSEGSGRKRWSPERSWYRSKRQPDSLGRASVHCNRIPCIQEPLGDLKLWSQFPPKAVDADSRLKSLKKRGGFYDDLHSRVKKEYSFILPYLRGNHQKQFLSKKSIKIQPLELFESPSDYATWIKENKNRIEERVESSPPPEQAVAFQLVGRKSPGRDKQLGQLISPDLRTTPGSKETDGRRSAPASPVGLGAPAKETVPTVDRRLSRTRAQRIRSKSVARSTNSILKNRTGSDSPKKGRLLKSNSSASLGKSVKTKKVENIKLNDITSLPLLAKFDTRAVHGKEREVRGQNRTAKKPPTPLNKPPAVLMKRTRTDTSLGDKIAQNRADDGKHSSNGLVPYGSTADDKPQGDIVRKTTRQSPVHSEQSFKGLSVKARGRSLSPRKTRSPYMSRNRSFYVKHSRDRSTLASPLNLGTGTKPPLARDTSSPLVLNKPKIGPKEPNSSNVPVDTTNTQGAHARSASKESARSFSRSRSKDRKLKPRRYLKTPLPPKQSRAVADAKGANPAGSKATGQGSANITSRPSSRQSVFTQRGKVKTLPLKQPQAKSPMPIQKRETNSPRGRKVQKQTISKPVEKKSKKERGNIAQGRKALLSSADGLKRKVAVRNPGQDNPPTVVSKIGHKPDSGARHSQGHTKHSGTLSTKMCAASLKLIANEHKNSSERKVPNIAAINKSPTVKTEVHENTLERVNPGTTGKTASPKEQMEIHGDSLECANKNMKINSASPKEKGVTSKIIKINRASPKEEDVTSKIKKVNSESPKEKEVTSRHSPKSINLTAVHPSFKSPPSPVWNKEPTQKCHMKEPTQPKGTPCSVGGLKFVLRKSTLDDVVVSLKNGTSCSKTTEVETSPFLRPNTATEPSTSPTDKPALPTPLKVIKIPYQDEQYSTAENKAVAPSLTRVENADPKKGDASLIMSTDARPCTTFGSGATFEIQSFQNVGNDASKALGEHGVKFQGLNFSTHRG
ncbi:uncharacterized protein LOC106012738 [Aplysia californica]|uniref:Uncharacterized protein LOC106012738 n=1 Tax=Aplysia californica TaxID=6500 RepID=A0ABM1A6W8_APLCA|nr:uncharacterized protein LOC106012738 [Aplysia californica]